MRGIFYLRYKSHNFSHNLCFLNEIIEYNIFNVKGTVSLILLTEKERNL